MFYSTSLSFHLAKNPNLLVLIHLLIDAQRRPLINFMAICEGGPIFLKAIYRCKKYKDKHYMTSLIKDVIEEIFTMYLFNEFLALKLLSVAKTHFASIIVMLKRLKLLKCCLQNMIISDQWNSHREYDIRKAANVNDIWWNKIDCLFSFTYPIYSMIRKCDTNISTFHLVYEM
ncbi:hypothetical protein CR513_44750, partial [Mucuna pruriens]